VDLVKIARRVASSHKRVSLDTILDAVQKTCPADLRPDIGKFVGSGMFGETYEVDGGDKVLKVAVARNEAEANSHLDNIRALADLNADVFVGVHDYGILCDVEVPKTTKYVNKAGVAYFYVMDKLVPVPKDEAKIAARTMDDLAQMEKAGMEHERAGKKKRYLTFKTKYHLKEGDFEEGGSNPVAKAFDLYDRMKAAGVGHKDIHGDNIMQDADGNYKLIDLEAARLLGKS
jgi:hypothetical protein